MGARGPSVTVVLDASYALAAFLEDESGFLLRGLSDESVITPPLFATECVNSLLRSVRSARFDPEGARTAMACLQDLVNVEDIDAADAFDVGLRTGLSGNDATYLALALATSSSIATLDGELARVAVAEGVPVLAV